MPDQPWSPSDRDGRCRDGGSRDGRSSRDAFLDATATLLRRQGYAATGLSEIVTRSEAPRGSLYFHFPDGKEQLATAAMRRSGEQLRDAIETLLASRVELADALGALVDALAAGLAASGYRDGCPIATVTLEAAAGSPAVRATAAEIFDSWLVVLERRLRAAGLGEQAARTRALLVLASLEGALLLARAMRDTSPLAAVREEIVALSADANADTDADDLRLSREASCTPR